MGISSIICSLKWFPKASDDLKVEYFKVSEVKLKITYKTTENVIFVGHRNRSPSRPFSIFYFLKISKILSPLNLYVFGQS